MMRSVCFVDRLELDFCGNHFPHAVTIGDVDNDGLNELLIGNVDGVLAIFKGDTANKPWKKCSGLGSVTCLGVGDVFNTGANALVVINAEAKCYIFNIESGKGIKSASQSPLATPTSPTVVSSRTMKPLHVQPLDTPNAKVMCIASILEENHFDLFVGLTDRRVAVYHWSHEASSFKSIRTFSVSGQVGCLSMSQSSEGNPQVLVSQPGGTYMPITCSLWSSSREPKGAGVVAAGREEPKTKEVTRGARGESRPGNGAKLAEAKYIQQLSDGLVLGSVVGQAQRRNPTSSTEVVGQIIYQSESSTSREDSSSTSNGRSSAVALCTLDGVVRLLKNEQKQWELQVEHSLFSIGKLDMTGNGEDEVVVCAWDGTTYIVDHNRNCVRFWFDQNVSSFCCGYYGNSEGKNSPCLVYTTFTNLIYLYTDITLPTVPASNLLLTLQNMEIPRQLKAKLDSMDSNEKQKLFHKCLYEYEERERTDPSSRDL